MTPFSQNANINPATTLVRDGAAVQHFNDNLFTPWVKENAAPGVVFWKRTERPLSLSI